MYENVRCIEPNLAIYFSNNELKHYNLVWGQWQYNDEIPDVRQSFITNMLLVKSTDGSYIPPVYPTEVEMQTQVDSLDYDGTYFYSVQAINSTPYYPGWVISKWQLNTDSYGLQRVKFKCFPGFAKATCLSLESYKFKMLSGTDPTRKFITVSLDYDYVIERIKVGHTIRIGPNNLDEVFWGTVSRVYSYPDNPYDSPQWYMIEFTDYINSSYVAGEDLFVQTELYVFDTEGGLNILNPATLERESRAIQNEYKSITACAFSLINNVPSINVGTRTPVLFYVIGLVVYCKRVTDLDTVIAVQTLPANFYADGNTFLPVYELRVRNDDPEDSDNYPQHYLLQKGYRSDRSDVGSDPTTWSTYNYVLQGLNKEAAQLILDVQPQILSQSGVAYCSCRILDNFDSPLSGISVTWSHTCGSGADFLDNVTSGTDADGYVYNRLYAYDTLDFPVYVSVTTEDI